MEVDKQTFDCLVSSFRRNGFTLDMAKQDAKKLLSDLAKIELTAKLSVKMPKNRFGVK